MGPRFLLKGLRGILRVAEVYGTYSTSVKDLYSYFGPMVTETEPQGPSSGDLLESVAYDVSTIKGGVDALHEVLSHVRVSCDEIMDYVKEKKKREKDKERQLFVENVGNVLIAIIKNQDKLTSNDPLEITIGVLDIISKAAQLISKPYGPIIGIIFGVIGAFLTESKPQQPSVVDRLARVVHDKLVSFNKRLQDQKYDGLKRRVSDQKSQLSTMRPGEKLDDPNLWNDYVQFMGELSNRFESPLPFKYEANLTSDPDVADFVTAVVTYCEAYTCFMALLAAAKGKFAELGEAYEEDERAVDRKISSQKEDAKEKLSFFSQEEYLTFLGRLPYEGGKLTKIIVLSRNMRGKSLVEEVRGSLGLTPMQDLASVEEAATKVARQSVKVKADRHPLPQPQRDLLVLLFPWSLLLPLPYRERLVQFINETTFPMKIVSGRVRFRRRPDLDLVKDVQPRASVLSEADDFYPGGYIIIYQNGILSPSTEPPAEQARVIEFAFGTRTVNIQDKTSDEFTYGQDTYNKMMMMRESWFRDLTDKTLYWFDNGLHFMAIGQSFCKKFGRTAVFRLVVQDFNPCSEEDLITFPKRY